MNIDKKRIYLVFALFLSTLLLVCFAVKATIFGMAVLAVFMAASAVAVCKLIKKRNILAITHRQVAYLMPVIAVVAIVLYYLIGIRFGYYKVITDKPEIYFKALFYIIVILSSEIMRAVWVSQKSKLIYVLSFVALLIVDVKLLSADNVFENYNRFMDFVGLTVFPMIASNLLYHSLSSSYGALPNILYKTIVYVYPCFIPVMPKVPDVMLAFLRIILYLVIYLFIRMLYSPRKFTVSRKKVVAGYVSGFVGMFLSVLFVMLISCQFRFGLLVIGTGSMTGTIDVGDAIIYEKYDGDVIEKEDIIVFEKNGVTIIHRVVDIKSIDGQVMYYTKGDANEDMDSGYITNDMIVGTVNLKIKYLGYPSVWMRALFK